MGTARKPPPAKLFTSIFSQDINQIEETRALLTKEFGPIDYKSRVLDFNYTEYYGNEFGRNLKRIFVSFKKLISPDSLYKIKIKTNRIEDSLRMNEKRAVNIDPGIINQANLMLATTKPYSHRIYINKGIYQEITLIYEGSTFKPLAWTYPDYKTKESTGIFLEMRNILNKQLKKQAR